MTTYNNLWNLKKKKLKTPIPKDSYGYDEISTKLLNNKFSIHKFTLNYIRGAADK